MITVKKEDLFQALMAVRPAVKTDRTTMPILTHTWLEVFGINGNSPWDLTVRAASMEAYAEAHCPCEFPSAMGLVGLCVPTGPLVHFVNRCDGPIKISPVQGKDALVQGKFKTPNRLAFSSGGASITLSVLNGADFPPPPAQISALQINLDAPELAECIRSVAWAADTNPVRELVDQRIGFINVQVTAAGCRVSATDRQVFAQASKPLIGASPIDFMIGANEAIGLAQNLDRFKANLEVTDSYAVCRHEKGMFAAKRLVGDYFPIHKVMGQASKALGFLPVPQLAEAMGTIRSVCSDGYAPTIIEATKEAVKISYESPVNSYDCELPITFGPFKVKVDGLKLNKALKAFPKDGDIELRQAENMILLVRGDLTVALALLHLGSP